MIQPMRHRDAPADFWHFLTHYKVWWITPIVVILLGLAAVALLTDDPTVIPFIYAD